MRCFVFLFLYLPFTAAVGQPVSVPFFLVGNTIFVEGTVNGQTGNFILDTGAPKLFLNSTQFQGVKIPWQGEGIMDINGHTSEVTHCAIKELSLSGFTLPNELALVTDLRSLEKSKGIAIAGILGYPVFKEVEVLFDFEKKLLLLFPLNRKGNRLFTSPDYAPVDSFEVKMSGHFPCIIASLNNRKLRLGIDSGAEVNVLHQKVFTADTPWLEAESTIVLTGMKNKNNICRQGKISGLNVGSVEMRDTEVVVADLDYLNEQLDLDLDGMLGTPFLMRGKMAINYKKKKLYVWEKTEGGLAEKMQTADTRKAVNGLK